MASNPVPFAILALAQARHDDARKPAPPKGRAVRPRHRAARSAADVVVPTRIVRGTPAPTT